MGMMSCQYLCSNKTYLIDRSHFDKNKLCPSRTCEYWLTLLKHPLKDLNTFSESKWYMMIGGLNSMDKVSLFNWETLQQCEFGLAPFFGYGLTGFSLNDVPLVCGAQRSVLSDKNECYEYNKNLNQWTRVCYIPISEQFKNFF